MRLWLIVATAVVVFVGVRLVYLQADPPTDLPISSAEWTELIVEGPAKAQVARNKALFGDWKSNPVDNYQFWRIQSPVWVYPLSWSFRAFGVGYPQLRIHSIVTAAIALVALLLIARRRFDGWPLYASGLFVIVNFYYVFFSRSGLLEPLLNSMLSVSVLCLLMALSSPLWLVGAQVAFVLALLTKQSALVLLPLLIFSSAWAIIRARRSNRHTWQWVLPIISFVVFAVALALYVQQDAYWRTVIWNYGHVLFNSQRVSEIDITSVPLAKTLVRLTQWSRWRDGFFLLMPVAAPLIILDCGRIGLGLLRKRRIDPWDALIALWFLSVLGSLQLTPLRSARFLIMLIPPGALLGASGLQTLLRAAEQVKAKGWPQRVPGPKALVLITLVIALITTHGRWFQRWAEGRTYVLAETNRDITSQIGERHAVLVGAWAAPLVFETKYETYYVKARFNSSKRALSSLGITHVLIRSRNDWTYRRIKRNFPDITDREREIQSYPLWRKYSVDLRALDPPLGQAAR